MATTIKVSEVTRDRVNDLGARTSQTAEQVVSRAIVEYERRLFWDGYAAASDAAAADREREAEEAAERTLWERATTRDAVLDG